MSTVYLILKSFGKIHSYCHFPTIIQIRVLDLSSVSLHFIISFDFVWRFSTVIVLFCKLVIWSRCVHQNNELLSTILLTSKGPKKRRRVSARRPRTKPLFQKRGKPKSPTFSTSRKRSLEGLSLRNCAPAATSTRPPPTTSTSLRNFSKSVCIIPL